MDGRRDDGWKARKDGKIEEWKEVQWLDGSMDDRCKKADGWTDGRVMTRRMGNLFLSLVVFWGLSEDELLLLGRRGKTARSGQRSGQVRGQVRL